MINITDAIANMQVLAERYTGKLAEHKAIAESIQVIKAFVDLHSEKSSAGVLGTEDISSVEIPYAGEVAPAKKSRKTRAPQRRR